MEDGRRVKNNNDRSLRGSAEGGDEAICKNRRIASPCGLAMTEKKEERW
jgi:hypothetical protein